MPRIRLAIVAAVLLQELGLVWFADFAPAHYVVYGPFVDIICERAPLGLREEVLIGGPHGVSFVLLYPVIPLALVLMIVALLAMWLPPRRRAYTV